MGWGDWIQTAVNGVIGVFLGIAVYGLLSLVMSGAWWLALILLVLFAVLFLILLLTDKLFDRLMPVRIHRVKTRGPAPRKPLAVVLSMPAGLIIGILLAMLGLSESVLNLIP